MISQSLKLLLFYTSMENIFVAEEEEEISLGMQMFKLHQWYLQKSKEEMRMIGFKYHDQNFFHGEDDFWVDFKLMHAIYCQDSLDTFILTIWVLEVSTNL